MGILRFLFATSVFFVHSSPYNLLIGGQLAVQSFYLFSGFLISFILLENKSYGVFEKGIVYSISDRSPFNLNSIGGLSGGPAFSNNNNLSGILVAENVRRALAILVDNRSLIELLNGTNMIEKQVAKNYQSDLVITNKNFVQNGESLREQGVIRKI